MTLSETISFTERMFVKTIFLFFLSTSMAAIGKRENYSPPSSSASSPTQSIKIQFTVDEELPIGARIGSILEQLASTQSIEFALMDEVSGAINFVPLTDERLVYLNRTSGLLTVRQRIDREALCGDLGVCCPGSEAPNAYAQIRNPSCAIRILVMDQRKRNQPFQSALPTQEQSLIDVAIYINDLNDNAPLWSPSKLELEIPEHTAIGRTFQLPEAKDPDQGPEHTVQHYQLIPNEAQKDSFSAYDVQSRSSTGDVFRLSTELMERVQDMPYKFNLRLKVNANLDREKQPIYNFLLTAVDGGGVSQGGIQMTGTLTIVVKVTDINDQTPYFRQPKPTIEITENSPVGSQIFTIVANDDDPSDANRLVYRLGSAATAEMSRLFAVDSRTGAVTILSNVDFETAPFLPTQDVSTKDAVFGALPGIKEVGYLIPIEVSDGAHIAETELRIRVINVNDNPPNISIQSHLYRSIVSGELFLKEDAAEGTLVATITMTDADERGRQAQQQGSILLHRDFIHYCSTTNPFFAVHPLYDGSRNHFKLVTSRALDHEAKSSHAITIHCHDSGQPSLSAKQHLTVRLEDVNDSPPIFDKAVYYERVAEGLPMHTPILQVHANDADTRAYADIRYRLVGMTPGAEQLVLLHQTTGQIRSAAVFDREAMSSVNFTVEAVDCAGNTSEGACGGIKSATAEVILIIEDMNDCTPEFEQQLYEFVIREGQMPKTLVGKVHAEDRDAETKNSRVRYTINDNSLDGHHQSPELIHAGSNLRASRVFSIASSGEIFTNSIPIDREQVPIITFSVVATDHGEPPLSTFATVVIRVEDVNDNAPQWLFPLPPPSTSSSSIVMTNPSAASVNISIFSTVGFVVATLKASDPDMGENGRVSFDILRGNEQGYFAMDKASGTLYLAKLLSLPTASETGNTQISPTAFTLSVKVSDGGEPERSNTSLLRIFILQEGVHDDEDDSDIMQTNDGRHQRQFSSRRIVDRDLLIMIVMIIITLLVSVLLITAIVFLRCRQQQGAVNRSGGGCDRAENGEQATRLMGKPANWLPNFSQESTAKSGFTLDSNKSSTCDYTTSTGPFMQETIKSFDGAYGHFSPSVLPPQQAVATFQRSDEHLSNQPVNFVFSKNRQEFELQTRGQNSGEFSPRLVRLASPNDAVFASNTLPINPNADHKQQNIANQRCYMTLNPDLYEVECPYGQLKYAGWNLMRARQRTDDCTNQIEMAPAEPLLIRQSNSRDFLQKPVASSSNELDPQQQQHQQHQPAKTELKRCRFNPMPPNIIQIDGTCNSLNNSDNTEDTLDDEDDDIAATPTKTIIGLSDPLEQTDNLLFDLQ